MLRKIKIAAYVLSILGLVGELTALLPLTSQQAEMLGQVRGFLGTLHLNYLRSSLLEYYNFDSGLRMGFIEVLAYSLILLGAIIMGTSNGREVRLVRFFAAIVSFDGAVGILWIVITPFFYSEQIDFTNPSFYLISGLRLIQNAALAYYSHKVVKYFSQTKELVTSDGTVQPVQQVASNWKRFANLCIDLVTCICLFTPLLPLFSFLAPVEQHFGERTVLWLFMVIVRIIYYVTFEAVYQATPGKLFTETRVVTTRDQKPDIGTIVGRTFSRFIPLEPFSFFGEQGWHDSITQTKVVNEVRTGVKGRLYLLIFPAILVIGVVSYVSMEYYKEYLYYLEEVKAHQAKVTGWNQEIERLSTFHIIEVEPSNEYASQETYLKVEIVDGDEITCSVITREQTYNKSLVQLEKLYNMMKSIDGLETVTFPIDTLKKAFSMEYEKGATTHTARLTGDGKAYKVVSIDRLSGPSIHDRGSGGISNTISIDLLNLGWPAQIVRIENLEGNIEWLNELPLQAPTVRDYDSPDFTISGVYTRGTPYQFKLTVTDSLNRFHYFVVEGVDLEKTVRRVD